MVEVEPMSTIWSILLSATGVLLLLRFMVQLARANFYSPLTQGIVKVTDLLCKGLRRIVPATPRIDTASLLVAWPVYIGLFYMQSAHAKVSVSAMSLPLVGLVRMADTLVTLYMVALFVHAIMSWIDPSRNYAVNRFSGELTRPILEPVRRFLPPFGILDFSTILVFLGLVFARSVVIGPLERAFLF